MHAAYDALLADVASACRRHYGDRLLSLAVYGSVGRGTPRPDSDVDLLLVATDLPDGPVARNDEFGAVRTTLAPRLAAAGAAGLHPELAPILKTRAELERGSPLLLDMTEDARILHDPDGCLGEAIDRLRRRLRKLGSRRVWRGDRWYWDLKPDYRPGDIFELFPSLTNGDLAASYLAKATIRLDIPPVLFDRAGYSDVVREAQEIVELALKGMLREAGIETPRWHDVGNVLREHAGRFPTVDDARIDQLADVSSWLRENRELSFYGDDDFIPTERYTREDAHRAFDGARLAVSVAATVIGSDRR